MSVFYNRLISCKNVLEIICVHDKVHDIFSAFDTKNQKSELVNISEKIFWHN